MRACFPKSNLTRDGGLSFLPASLPAGRPVSCWVARSLTAMLTPRDGRGLPVALRGVLNAIDAFGDFREGAGD